MESAVSSQVDRTTLPNGLRLLLAGNFAKTLCYQGLRTILVVYLTSYLSREVALSHYRVFTSFVFFAPIFGAVISDWVFDRTKTILIGGILLSLGSFLLTIDSTLVPALVIFATGIGFINPNLTTQYGSLFSRQSLRIEYAFFLFLLVTNIASFLSPFVFGTMNQLLSFDAAMFAIGATATVATSIYFFQSKKISALVQADEELKAERKDLGWKWTADEKKVGVSVAVVALAQLISIAVNNFGDRTESWILENHPQSDVAGVGFPSQLMEILPGLAAVLLIPLIVMMYKAFDKKAFEESRKAKIYTAVSLLGLSLLTYGLARIIGDGQSMIWAKMGSFFSILAGMFVGPLFFAFIIRNLPKRYQATAFAVLSTIGGVIGLLA